MGRIPKEELREDSLWLHVGKRTKLAQDRGSPAFWNPSESLLAGLGFQDTRRRKALDPQPCIEA